MITNGCVKELRRLLGLGRTLGDSARMAEMSEKTERKYRDDDRRRHSRLRIAPIARAAIPLPTCGTRCKGDSNWNRGSKRRRCLNGCSKLTKDCFLIPHGALLSDA